MRLFVLGFASAFVAALAQAAPVVPEPLAPWVDWVLHDIERCPPRDAAEQAPGACFAPGLLTLTTRASGVDFDFEVVAYAPAFVALPGGRRWPAQAVTVDGNAAVTRAYNAFTGVDLTPGRYRIAGSVPFAQRPEWLPLPTTFADLALVVDGAPVRPVEREDDQMRLGTTVAASQRDELELEVVRVLRDGPLPQLSSHLWVKVTGRAREWTVPPMLPTGFRLLEVGGELPIRALSDGSLRVALTAGNHELRVEAVATDPEASWAAPTLAAPWPAVETWAYAADLAFRSLELRGAPPADVNQVWLPESVTETLPVYSLGGGTVLERVLLQRGQPLRSNSLKLKRELWLDYRGLQWLARDTISGELEQGWRLALAAPWSLEQAETDEPLTLTRIEDQVGVEVRQPELSLTAVAIADRGEALVLSGWNEPMQEVAIDLRVPPGWSVLMAAGASTEVGTWRSRWNLWSVFLAALLTVLAARLLGRVGALAAMVYALTALTLDGAPDVQFLALFAATGLVVSLQPSRLRALLLLATAGVVVVLVAEALPFARKRALDALYPQVAADQPALLAPAAQFPQSPAFEQAMDQPARGAMQDSYSMVNAIATVGSRSRKGALIQRYDSDAVQNVSRAAPEWQREPVRLRYAGPVDGAEALHLWLQPPWLARLSNVLAIASLLTLIALLLARIGRRPARTPSAPSPVVAVAVLLCLPLPALAQGLPDPALLEALRSRLTEAADCAPDCVRLAQVEVRGDSAELALDFEVHVSARSWVVLPDLGAVLSTPQLLRDGVAVDGVRRSSDGHWEVVLERGVHRLSARGPALPGELRLAFVERPDRIATALDGFETVGLKDQQLAAGLLSLLPTQSSAGSSETAPAARVAPLVRVTRTVTLNLDYTVHTAVERIAPSTAAFTVTVPLWPGERLADDADEAGIDDDGERIRLSLAAGEDLKSYHSVLERRSELVLTAASDGTLAERWLIYPSAIFRVEGRGLPWSGSRAESIEELGHALRADPAPGQSLTLAISRPAAIGGATLAIDRLALNTSQGARSRDHTLSFTVRATQAQTLIWPLPASIELLRVERDGTPLSIMAHEGKLALPVVPGSSSYQLALRDAVPLGLRVELPTLPLPEAVSNLSLTLNLPAQRWLIASVGPAHGPALLAWPMLALLLLVTLGFAHLVRSPLNRVGAVLLAAGFTFLHWLPLVIVLAFLWAVGARARLDPQAISAWRFNLIQLGMVLLTALALLALLIAVPTGLLSAPDMGVIGSGSSAGQLRYYVDQASGQTPVAAVYSLPTIAYQAVMLGFSIWLVLALLGWLHEAWRALAHGGGWRSMRRAPPAGATKEPPVAAGG